MRGFKKEKNLRFKDGKWLLDFYQKKENGKLKRVRRFAGRTKTEALDLLNELKMKRTKAKLGLASAPEKKEPISFSDFSEKFLALYSRPNRRAATILSHLNSLKSLKAFFKAKVLTEITSEEVARFIAQRKTQVSAASVNRELSCLKCLFNRSIEWGYCETSPVKVKKLREPKAKDRILSDAEVDRLLTNANPNLLPVLIVLLGTAMRKSECLSLRWSNVDFRKGFIFIGAEDSKSGRSREIPMSLPVFETLRSLHEVSKSEHVFFNPETKSNVKNIRTSFQSALKKAAIKGVTIHSLRHTAGSKWVELGVDLRTVQILMGHSSLSMVERYTHPTQATQREAVAKLASIFERTSQKVDTSAKPTIAVASASVSKLTN